MYVLFFCKGYGNLIEKFPKIRDEKNDLENVKKAIKFFADTTAKVLVNVVEEKPKDPKQSEMKKSL